MTIKLFKVLENGRSCHGGNLKWDLPTRDDQGNWTPGRWHGVRGDIDVCSRGLHLTTQPGKWMTWNSTVYEAEGAGQSDQDDDKIAFRRARLLRPAAVPDWWVKAHEFVAGLKDVPFFRPDGRPLPDWELFTAPTWSAARTAAGTAARHAARHAAGTAAWDAAWDAAWAAAWAAARAAARHAAGDAAGTAARAAARHAARHAAGTAAWHAAGDAAWHAAGDAAWHAAGDAAGHAALQAEMIVTADLNIETKHRAYARARWRAISKGYGVLCDVDGKLYVYAADGDAPPVGEDDR